MRAVVGTNPSQSARVSAPKFGVRKSTILPRFGQMNEVKKCGFHDDLNKEKTEIRPVLFACLLNTFSRRIVVCHKKKITPLRTPRTGASTVECNSNQRAFTLKQTYSCNDPWFLFSSLRL